MAVINIYNMKRFNFMIFLSKLILSTICDCIVVLIANVFMFTTFRNVQIKILYPFK